MNMGKKGRPSLSPDELLARQFRAKCKFKATIRFVIANLYWLSDVEEEELGDNVQRNVMLLTRKREKKRLLSLKDKSILSKLAHKRTEEEKKHLNRVIGGLKCFRRYPSHVKRQLAAVTYYVYYGPGRVLIKQEGFAQAMYFVITGDVAISQEAFDPVVNEMVKIPLGEMGPGSLFGEVSLLHDIPRTATVTTINHCELLCLRRDDFNVVLKTTLQAQWNQVLTSMKMFRYFDEWDEIAKRECCILSKMITFEPEQTILGDGFGLTDYVYFVLHGKCRLIEHLYIICETIDGFKYYRLYAPLHEDSSISVNHRENDPGDKHKPLKISLKEALPDYINKSLTVLKEESKSGLRERSKSILGNDQPFEAPKTEGRRSVVSIKSELNVAFEEKNNSQIGPKPKSRVSIVPPKSATAQQNDSKLSEGRSSVKLSLSTVRSPRAEPELHFVQVCYFNATACFGIGENMKNRRIVAVAETKCLLIPRYWLMQKTNGNIWNRVQQFLNRHVPTTKQVFNEFVMNKKWLNYRKKLVDDILARRHSTNDNNYSNLPYTIRINENVIFP